MRYHGQLMTRTCVHAYIHAFSLCNLVGGEGTPRGYHAACYLPPRKGGGGRGGVVVFGGFTGEEPLSHLEVARQIEGCGKGGMWEWAKIQVQGEEPCARFGHSMTLVHGGHIVLMGGCTGAHNLKSSSTDGEELRDVFILTEVDTDAACQESTFRWARPQLCRVPPPFCIARCHSAVAFGQGILVFGGGPSRAMTNEVVQVKISGLEVGVEGGEKACIDWKIIDTFGVEPSERQGAHVAAIRGGSEIIVFGGWRREELGDLHVLSLGALDEGRYMLSRGKEEQDRCAIPKLEA